MEAPDLKKAVEEQDWGKTSRILKGHPELAKEEFSKSEFHILWRGAPLETIQVLLEVWPDAYEKKNLWGRNLVQTKIYNGRWDILKSILPSCPNSVTTNDVRHACYGVPLDVFELMLRQQPNAPLEYPSIIFELITLNKLDHFCAVVERCPGATELKHGGLQLTPLLIMFQDKEKINADWIGPLLKANPDSARQKDFDGRTALHLAYQYGVSELITMIQQSCPQAENIRDNLGRLPKDLSNLSEKTVFMPANEALILRDNLNDERKLYPDNAVVLCRGDILIRDPQTAENEEDKKTYKKYLEQVLARDRIFETLLEEFSKMVGIKDKDVIQKAAAIQALAVQYLSNQGGTIINFGSSENPGYWYQQEILKLVMRVYREGQSKIVDYFPSVSHDANICKKDLAGRKNGKPSPRPSYEYYKAYEELKGWLTEGLNKSLYSVQGPVLKPLQSLFNKLFIRRGQTSVHVISDMVRGTLSLDNMAMLDEVVNRIKNTFPNITGNQFRHPDSFNGLADFLTYVHDDLDFLPGSNDVLPYRFKANSSQKKKEKPLWYNLNFFLKIPEYHRVGFSEMFVACELQIGVEEEIHKHRSVHDAYERDRILSNQPLLKNYDTMRKEEEGEGRFSRLSNSTEDDNKLIEKVLFGKIATEVLVPCTVVGTDNKSSLLAFRNGRLSLSRYWFEAGSFLKAEQLCTNNRSLNWYALHNHKEDQCGRIPGAFRVAGPYKLDERKRYFVDSLVFQNTYFHGFYGAVGLYAHVGPYLIQITCSSVTHDTENALDIVRRNSSKRKDIVVVKSGQNLLYLEQVCPVPVGTTALEVIVYGRGATGRQFGYDGMSLSLKVFDVH